MSRGTSRGGGRPLLHSGQSGLVHSATLPCLGRGFSLCDGVRAGAFFGLCDPLPCLTSTGGRCFLPTGLVYTSTSTLEAGALPDLALCRESALPSVAAVRLEYPESLEMSA